AKLPPDAGGTDCAEALDAANQSPNIVSPAPTNVDKAESALTGRNLEGVCCCINDSFELPSIPTSPILSRLGKTHPATARVVRMGLGKDSLPSQPAREPFRSSAAKAGGGF